MFFRRGPLTPAQRDRSETIAGCLWPAVIALAAALFLVHGWPGLP